MKPVEAIIEAIIEGMAASTQEEMSAEILSRGCPTCCEGRPSQDDMSAGSCHVLYFSALDDDDHEEHPLLADGVAMCLADLTAVQKLSKHVLPNLRHEEGV